MKKNAKPQDIKNNARVVLEVAKKGNKVYNNYVAYITLDNGNVVKVPVKLKFYNRKFDYLLSQHLPKGE